MPVLLAVLPWLIRRLKVLAGLIFFGYLGNLVLTLYLCCHFLKGGGPVGFLNVFYVDALSVFFMLTVSVVALASSLYSRSYIAHDLERGLLTEKKARIYYSLFSLFVLSMLTVTVVNNLGLMWAAIEMTTLVSAFLVGFYNTEQAVEAAWKYIIICSVGIILALLGTILFSFSYLFLTGLKSLNWTDLMTLAGGLDKDLVRIAFIFIIIGYGTKAGLAPMHTWLPDAHSQALSPISALLSGVLLPTAIYAILRYSLIANVCLGSSFVSRLFLLFALLSLAVAAGFVLIQKDIKRLLAYSSIEHIGLIAFGLGIGGWLGFFGALWHVFNHAVTKSLLFFGAGNIVNKYGTHNFHQIRGVIRVLPFTGVLVLVGVFALTGLPPFSIFFSEIMILIAAFDQGSYWLASLVLLFLAVIFGALIYHFSEMLFGAKPKDISAEPTPLTDKMAFIFLLVLMLAFGWVLPGPFAKMIGLAVGVLKGV